jgi:hypothetical protein
MEIQKMKSNYGKGPSTGNASARPGKREVFKEGKEERSNLADSINRAFTARSATTNSKAKTYIDPALESVASDVKPKKFKR